MISTEAIALAAGAAIIIFQPSATPLVALCFVVWVVFKD